VEYDRTNLEYDTSPIFTDRTIDYADNGRIIYISALQRTNDTARLIFGDKNFRKSKLFNEVFIDSFMDSSLQIPRVLWNFIGRVQWFFNSSRQSETRLSTVHRVRKAIRYLEKQNEDCVIVCHAFYMRVLIFELKRKGYRQTNQSQQYDNLGVNELEK
jgi:Fructose-2,6-bisphosphatase